MRPLKRWIARPKVIAAALALLAILVVIPVWVMLGRPASLRREALSQARRLADDGKADLALRHLDQYLSERPGDPEALDLQARLASDLARTPSQALDAARLHERLVRLDPDGPDRQQTRKRLVRLYLRHADAVRESALTRTAPTLAVRESQYHAAEQVARQILRRGDDSAEAHGLLARALEGLAVPGDKEALRLAIAEYEQALKRDPADSDSAYRLADLDFGRAANPAKGDRVLDAILAARPGPASRLARYRTYDRLGRRDRAAAELEAAVAESPADLDVRLAATSEAIRKGDLAAAKRHLDAVPATAVDDPRVRIARGLIDFGDSRTDEAIAGWRRGLLAAGGADSELTWWLGYALIQIGRVGEARALVGQYHRLEGDEGEPLYFLLRGLMEQRGGRPVRAIRDLVKARDKVGGLWLETALLALGRCYEDINDPGAAFASYRKATQAEPGSAPPRLAMAALLAKQGKFPEAAADLKRGLDASPHDSKMLLALARVEIREQITLQAKARKFDEIDRVLALAKEAAGPRDQAELATLIAERRTAAGDLAASVEVLAAAATANPRSSRAWSNWAEALARRGRLVEALDVLDRGARAEAAGDSGVIRVSRAAMLMGMGRGREARLILVDHPERLPVGDRPPVWELAARFAESKGDLAAAREAYLAWAGGFRDDPRPRLGLLGLALNAGDAPAARLAVDALRDPSDPGDVAWRLGRALERLITAESPGRDRDRAEALREGIELTDAVLADAPEVAAGSFLKGWGLRLRGKADDAAEAYRRAWERGIDAALPPLVEQLASRGRIDDLLALRQRRPAQAIEADRLAAGALVRLGKADAAARFLDRIAESRENSPQADLWLARMLDRAGKTDRAEALLRSLADRRPSEPEPWLVLLRYQVEHGRKEAIEATRERLRTQASGDHPWVVAARVLWTCGETSAAGRAFDQAVAAHPDDVPTRLAAAGFYEGTGRLADAEACLRYVLARDRSQRAAARELATLLADQAKDDLEAWRKALEILGPEPNPEPSADLIARAYVLSRSPDAARRAEAIPRLEGLVADLPPTDLLTGQAARRVLIKLLMEADQPARAAVVAGISAALGDDPADVALYAEAALRSGNLAEASRQLNLLAMLAPGDSREAALRARLIGVSTSPGGVVAALEKAVSDRREAPGSAALAREVVEQLEGLGPRAADAAGRVALRLAVLDPGACWMLGRQLSRQGLVDEALKQCRQAVAVASVPKDAQQAALVALQAARSPRAPAGAKAESEAILDEALRRHPDSVPLIDLAIILRHEQAAFEDEVRLCRRALALEPGDPLALNNLACALCEGLKQPGQALAVADELVRVRGRIPATLGTRGLVLTRLRRLDEAIRDLEMATRDLVEPAAGASSPASPADPTSLLRLAYLARAYKQANRLDDFRRCRDLARKLGLEPRTIDASERDEIAQLLTP